MEREQTFASWLKQQRKALDLTQGDLARLVGCAVVTLQKIEEGRRRPSKQVAELLARYLEIAPDARDDFLRRARAEPAVPRSKPSMSVSSLHIPTPPTALIGRVHEMEQICALLRTPEVRLVTLTGSGGIGKTRLGLQVAAELPDDFPDGVYFVDLAPLRDPALVIRATAQILGVKETGGQPLIAELKHFLSDKRLLLLLDNFEQVLDAAPLMAELIATAPQVKLLVTSRERLNLRAEQRYRVPPLALASAVALFAERATAVDVDFVLVEANRPSIEAICQQMDRLPLAIELCAAQIDLLPPSQLLARLQEHRLELLVDGTRDMPLRHRTLHNALQHSYDLLDEAERTLFRSLGVFVGGFDVQALETASVWHEEPSARSLLSILHTLIGKSLVHTETTPVGEQRFLLLETIREFALEQLRAHGEEALWRERHYAMYLQLFRIGDSHLRGPDAVMWFARLEIEQDNLRTAFQWTLETARYEEMAWLIVAANWFWEQHGLQYDAGKWLVQLLPHRHQLGTDLRLAIWVILNAAIIHIPEELQPMSRCSDEAIELLEDCTDNLLQSAVWIFMAWNTADFSQRSAKMEQAIAFARAGRESPGLGPEFCLFTDCDFMLGMELGNYAYGLAEQGELARAETLAWEGLHIFQARGNRYERAVSLGLLGRLALLRGDLGQAHKLLTEALTIAASVNYKDMQCHCQPLLGLITLYNGDRIVARQLLAEGLRLCVAYKAQHLLAYTCTYLAETALWEGKLDEAEQWLRQSLGYYAAPHQITVNEVTLFWVAARLATAQQQYQRATTLFGLADQAHSRMHNVIGGPMRALADVALATVRASLDPAAFSAAFAAGQQLSLDEAFSTI